LRSSYANRVDESGFTIVEVLVAMGITLSVMGGALTIVSGFQVGFGTEGERADGQQRLRVAVNALSRDLSMAGTGPFEGARAGPLGFSVASVFPFRQGATRADPPGTVRRDVVTVAYVPAATAAQATIRLPMPASSGAAFINLDPGCPLNDPACGFSAGMDVMIYDDTGAGDTFRVLAVQPGSLQLQHTMADTAQWYAPGARIVEAASHTYYLKADRATDTFQLMHYDGVGSDVAVVDHVIALAFDYFGEPSPPTLLRPVTDPTGPWTTYGPAPPRPGLQSTAYPAGENCAFQLDASGLEQVPRLATLGDGLGTTLVALTDAQLGDGPWCPDAMNAHAYDADLLRIRRISVTLRLEAALAALRGPAGTLFMRGGTARAAARWAPDQEIRFDLAPRNLSIGR
jgi:hypothetical protein